MNSKVPNINELFVKVREAYQNEVLGHVVKTVRGWKECLGEEQLPDFETGFHKLPSFSLRLKNARETYFRQLDIAPLTSEKRDALWRQAEMKLYDLRKDLAAISDIAEDELKKEVRSFVVCWFDFSDGLNRLSADSANKIYDKLWADANGNLSSYEIEAIVRKFKELLLTANFAVALALDDSEKKSVSVYAPLILPPHVGS